jgi:hypothetical protein
VLCYDYYEGSFIVYEALVYNFDLNIKMMKVFCIPGML